MYWLITQTFLIFLFCAAGLAQGAGPLELKMERLPQEPVAATGGSDLVDEDLKGKVKMVVVESSEVSQQSIVGPRRMSQLLLFNEKGHLIQRDYYGDGRPHLITQYGYIDGKRVTKGRAITYDDDPPAPPAPPEITGDRSPRDWRYNLAYESAYSDGKLAETKVFLNNGKLSSRTVYKRSKDQIERTAYNMRGELYQRSLMKLDRDGNVIEETSFSIYNNRVLGDRKFRYSYEFDKQGNWVKKTTSLEAVENGKSVFKPMYVLFRTITYF